MFSITLFRWQGHDSCCVCFFAFLSSLSLVTFTSSYWCLEIVVSDHYSVDFQGKEWFDFNHSLWCVYLALYSIKLLGRVYHFSFVICHPCSCYFCVLMLATLNSLLVMKLGKTRKLPQILIRPWLFL